MIFTFFRESYDLSVTITENYICGINLIRNAGRLLVRMYVYVEISTLHLITFSAIKNISVATNV